MHAEARARPAAYILQAKLSNPFFRFSPADFTVWFCFQFRIPQAAHLGNANAVGVEQCLGSCRRRDVDLHGNHAHAPCKVCLLGRGHRHRYLKNVVSHHAARAGCIASWVREDSTAELLLRQFTPEQCSTMFPLKAPAALAEGAQQVLADLRAAAALPADLREAKLVVCDARLQQLRDSVVDGHGLRLDGTLLHPASGEQVWFDVSAVHTTCQTHLKGEVTAARERRAAGKDGTGRQSAALMEGHQDKLDRYSLLQAMVERQVLAGLRTAAPLILPVVVSTHGEFCPGTVQLQEWLIEQYRARLRLEGDRDDGEEEDDLITAFRCELRAALLVATAKGTAEMMAVAGRPFRKGGAQRSRAWPDVRAPAARAADHSADDVAGVVSDSDNDNDHDNDSVDATHISSDQSGSSTSDSENNASDSDARGGSAHGGRGASVRGGGAGGGGARGGGARGTAARGAPLSPIGPAPEPRTSARSSARLVLQRAPLQPESAGDSALGQACTGGPSPSLAAESDYAYEDTPSSSCRRSSSRSSSSSIGFTENNSIASSGDGGSQDQPFPIVESL